MQAGGGAGSAAVVAPGPAAFTLECTAKCSSAGRTCEHVILMLSFSSPSLRKSIITCRQQGRAGRGSGSVGRNRVNRHARHDQRLGYQWVMVMMVVSAVPWAAFGMPSMEQVGALVASWWPLVM